MVRLLAGACPEAGEDMRTVRPLDLVAQCKLERNSPMSRKPMFKSPLTLFAPLAALLLLVGCRAQPAPNSGFLHDPTLMKVDKDLPFNRVYVNQKFKDTHFTKVYVAPINTDYVMAQNTWAKSTLADLNKQDVSKNANRLADYMRNSFINACDNDPTRRFQVVDKPDSDTLILEMAIVQLVPSKAELQALSMVPVGFVGLISTGVMAGGSAVARSEDQGKGVIAMEGRTRAGASGEVVCMFADRQRPPTAILDLKVLFWWEPAKPICHAWAKQFVKFQTSPPGTRIKKISNFELLVW